MKKNQEILRLVYPPGFSRNAQTPLKDFGFIKTLKVDDMIVLINENYRGLTDLKLEDYFSCDEQVLSYRLDVVDDLVNNSGLYKVFCESIKIIQNIFDMRKAMSSDFSVEASLGAIRILETYIDIIELYYNGFLNVPIKSSGLAAFSNYINETYLSDEFNNLKNDLSGMQLNLGTIKSFTIGVNLDETLQVKDAGIVSINTKHFHPGTLVDKLLKRQDPESYSCMTSLFPITRGLHGEELKSINYCAKNGIHTVFHKCLREFEPIVQKYFSVNTSIFISLLDDIRFLTAGVRFILFMREKGFPMCRPTIASIEEKRCDLSEVYNPKLALRGVEKTIVSNEFCYDSDGRFYLVTGPNHGGKSIFAYSVATAQALFQLGLYVPAVSAHISPATGIFTHFPASDENNYGKGRLESECARLGKIMKHLRDTDLLFMDESFSSTSGLEAGYIASEVLTGIGILGCGGIFVTHIHDLPQQVATYNSHPQNKGKIDNLVAQMEDRDNGTRSYKVVRSTPEGLSYAKDIASQYGLNLEGILEHAVDA